MKRITLFLFALTIISLACGETQPTEVSPLTTLTTAPPVPKGNRILSIDVNPAKDGDYESAFQVAQLTGMEQTGIFLVWTVLETAPGVYDSSLLDISSAYYPAKGVKLDITLAVVNTTRREFPADLADKTFDDPLVIERFKKLIDFVFSKTEAIELGSLNIGSEYDILFGTDKEQWRQFQVFYKEIAAYVKEKRPDLKLAVEGTFNGLTGSAKSQMQILNQSSDIIGVSYYPLEANGNVKDPSTVRADFDLIASLYPDQPIYFFQFGYPSSEYIKSSEERQSQFIREAFQAWDAHADHILMLDFTWLHDKSPEEVREFEKYYGFSNRPFAEFLGTLGLRTYGGKDKPAFQILIEEAKARGW
ncbi:MAG: hypothetical protein HZB50_10115 [Chloroflexi bacterium]|nr:hypothetical protein [Chloroflexota bacterium]